MVGRVPVPQPPVILAGAHRSGTSLVTRLLDQAGLFVGHELEENHEALFFLGLNQWVLSNAGAMWDRPLPAVELLGHAEARAAVADYLERSLNSTRARKFLGPRRFLSTRNPRRLREPWGWKDPRNTATLPFWLDLFPDARVVVVDRHGVDVAASLHARFNRVWPERIASYERFRWTYRFRRSRNPVTRSVRAATPEGAFDVWRDFQAMSRHTTAQLGDRLMRFRYEDLLARPRDILPDLLAFCGLPEPDLDVLAAGIHADRAYAYRGKPELVELAKRRSGDLADWGYSP